MQASVELREVLRRISEDIAETADDMGIEWSAPVDGFQSSQMTVWPVAMSRKKESRSLAHRYRQYKLPCPGHSPFGR